MLGRCIRHSRRLRAVSSSVQSKKVKTHIKKLIQRARLLRLEVTQLLFASGSGHWGSSLGTADIFAVLFFGDVMRYGRKASEKNDRFILSNGHICPIFYTVLAQMGCFGDKKPRLRRLGSPLQGHPSHIHLPWVETATGPLGQGVGVAVGKALALKLKKSQSRVFCMTSDGEHQEGSTWEAISSAGHFQLDNLIYILDRNHLQISGSTDDIANLGNIKKRYELLGWRVFSVDGHSIPDLVEVFKNVQQSDGRPTLVICNTVMGKGVPFIENNYRYHGKAPTSDEYERALEVLK